MPPAKVCPVCGAAHAVCTGEATRAVGGTRYVPFGEPGAGTPLPVTEQLQMALLNSAAVAGRGARVQADGDYVSAERLYLDAAGQVVGARDPSRVTLLAGAGALVPRDVAVRHGLMTIRGETRDMAGEIKRGGPGPDDPGAFYDDGTPKTPAGNEADAQAEQDKPLATEVATERTDASGADDDGVKRGGPGPHDPHEAQGAKAVESTSAENKALSARAAARK